MAPETVPPFFVEFFKVIMIVIFEPISERFLTKFAMAFTAILVGYMPHLESRMIFVSFCDDCIDFTDFLTVNGGGETMVMAYAEFVSYSAFFNTENFRIFLWLRAILPMWRMVRRK